MNHCLNTSYLVQNRIEEVYLAGPMRGIDHLNFPAFEEGARHLRSLGLHVTSPAEKDIAAGWSSENQRPWIECACEDAIEVLKSQAVVVLPGWVRSRGTRFEVMAAMAADTVIPILDYETLHPVENVIQIIAFHDTPAPSIGKVDEGVNPKDLLGMKKPPLRLVPPALLLYVSRVMALGAKKYGPYNWRGKKIQHSIYLEAAMRHILSALDGEKIDPESGMPHEAHAAACMGIVLDAMSLGIIKNDLPMPGAASKLISDFTEKN